MSLSAPGAPQISAMEPGILKSQFHAPNGAGYFRLVSPQRAVAKRRNVLAGVVSRYNVPGRDKLLQGDFCGMRAILAIILLCTASAAGQAQAEPSAETIAHGKALTEAADCASCHTADSSKPFAGGKRIDTPFGAIYSPNLTPDRDTGLGTWSDEDFRIALRYGVAPDGSRYYPAFPYPYFTKLTRDDLSAIRAYLASLTSYSNPRRPTELRWPLNYRVVMRAWNSLFFRPGIFEPNQQKSAEWNRGGYLVTGAGHCGGCHTPKNMLSADRRGRAYGGGSIDGWFAPRLDSAAR